MLVGPVLSHKLIEATPWNLLQYAVEYTIVVLHGLILLPCPKTSPNAWSTEESMPCTLSTKFKPDSRGPVPGIHVLKSTKTWMAGTSPAMTEIYGSRENQRPSRIKHDHAAHRLAGLHRCKTFVDFRQFQPG